MTGNKAALFPAIEDVYPTISYLSLHYRGETLLLELSLFILYTIPAFTTETQQNLITSKFSDVEERWLPSNSTFRFSDNYFDVRKGGNKYGEIMFVELAQETQKSEDCTLNCVIKYDLKVRYRVA